MSKAELVKESKVKVQVIADYINFKGDEFPKGTIIEMSEAEANAYLKDIKGHHSFYGERSDRDELPRHTYKRVALVS